MSRRPSPDAAERILTAASRLFYEQGINAVGLQQIIDACGCGKSLLYREFDSKDELVAAYLERLESQWQHNVAAAIEPRSGDPHAQLAAVVDAAAAEVLQADYRGCAFLNALAEVADSDSPAHKRAAGHVEELRSLLTGLAGEAKLHEPTSVADQLVIVISGMQTTAPVIGGARAASTAKTLTRAITDAAR